MSVLTRSGSLDAAVPTRRSHSMECKALQQHLHQQSLSQHEVSFIPVDDPPVKDSSPDASEDASTDSKEHPPASAASHLFTAASVLAALFLLTMLVVSTAPLLSQDAGDSDSGGAAQDQASLPPAHAAFSAADLDDVAAEARAAGASGAAGDPVVRWLGADAQPEPKAERWTVVLAPRRGAAVSRTPPATPVPTREPNDDEEPHGVETVAADVGRHGGEGGYEDHVEEGDRERDDSRGRTFSKEFADYLANDAALEREREHEHRESGASRGHETASVAKP
eukprot:Rhum_TRINITY_DN14641_c35_g1::Rhum_TRINITY_DN14641_c35_g1_i1::g.103288::m.103288